MSCELHPQLAALNGGTCPICATPKGPQPFHVITADPAWQFDDKLPGEKRGAEKHYNCAPHEEIMRYALPPTADDCHLFLWRVSAMVEEAYEVVRAWGFTPKSELVWRKTTVKGKRHFGMGRHVRAEHETCIIAVRGRPKVKCRSIRSVFDAPDLTPYDECESDIPSVFDAPAPRTAGPKSKIVHSRKPPEFFALVESLCPGAYVELFARELRPGWTSIGDQVPGNPTTMGAAIDW